MGHFWGPSADGDRVPIQEINLMVNLSRQKFYTSDENVGRYGATLPYSLVGLKYSVLPPLMRIETEVEEIQDMINLKRLGEN